MEAARPAAEGPSATMDLRRGGRAHPDLFEIRLETAFREEARK
jgi:hypothetical protein